MKVPEWIKKIGVALAWVGGIIAVLLVGKKVLESAIFGKVEKPAKWHVITPTTISVFDYYMNMYRRVKLPIDRRTEKRIKPSEIEAVGVSEKGGKVNVQIKHTATNRRVTDSDNSNG